MSKSHFHKRKLLAAITLIGLITFIFIFIYPQPFKQPYLHQFSPRFLQSSDPEFSYVGLFQGCKIEIHPTEVGDPISLGALPSKLETRFSPWISSLDGILYPEAYFHTLKFNECYRATLKEYPGIDLRAIVFNGNAETMLRIGGITEYTVPLSHANTLLIFTRINGQHKFIILKGGN